MEIVLAAIIFAALALGLARLFSKLPTLFKRTSVRQQVTTDARICLDTIVQRLRNGQARTYMISTPSNSASPNSRIDFNLEAPLLSGATAYAIYLAGNSVYGLEFVPPGGARQPHLLANNVTGLIFSTDTTDPALVYVSLRMEAPWDTTGDPTHVTTLIMPDEVVHLVEAQ